MSWKIITPVLGHPGIEEVRESGTLPVGLLGQVVTARHPTYGAGEFVFLKGVTSQVAGNVVIFNESDSQVTLSPDTPNTGVPVAVAMAATTADAKYGWFAIGGVVPVKKTAVQIAASDNKVLQSATAGRVMDSANSGAQILGAVFANAATVTATTSTVLVRLNRPHMQGQAT